MHSSSQSFTVLKFAKVLIGDYFGFGRAFPLKVLQGKTLQKHDGCFIRPSPALRGKPDLRQSTCLLTKEILHMQSEEFHRYIIITNLHKYFPKSIFMEPMVPTKSLENSRCNYVNDYISIDSHIIEPKNSNYPGYPISRSTPVKHLPKKLSRPSKEHLQKIQKSDLVS